MEKTFGQRKSRRRNLDSPLTPDGGIFRFVALRSLSGTPSLRRGINSSPDEFLKILFSFFFLLFSIQIFSQKLQTEKGDFVKLDYRNSIVVFFDPECPICQKYTKNLKEFRGKYADKGIKVYLIYPFEILPEASLQEFKEEYQFDFEIYFDRKRKLFKKLKATTSPEAFLVDKNRKTLYHGAIDNWFYGLGKNRAKPTEFYLLDALEGYLKNENIKVKYVEPVGCLL